MALGGKKPKANSANTSLHNIKLQLLQYYMNIAGLQKFLIDNIFHYNLKNRYL